MAKKPRKAQPAPVKLTTSTKEAEEVIGDLFSAIKVGKRPSREDRTKSVTTKEKEAPASDGLYRAAEKTVEMDDDSFFGTRRRKASSSAFTDEDLKREGVSRIVSMTELNTLLSQNAKAGTTPNCPFDCDCCF